VIPLRDSNPTRRRPVVTIGLVVACVAIFAFELFVQATDGEAGLERLFADYGLVPGHLTAALGGASDRLPWALITVVSSMFLHGGWIHLVGNLLYLWIFGNNVEDRLGRPAFLAFYLSGGVVAALAQVAIDPASDVPLVGASGAIAAVLGAYAIMFPRARVLAIVFLVVFFAVTEVPSILVLGLWFVLQVIDGLASLGVEDVVGGVAIFAHIAGFLVGILVGLLVRGFRPRPLGAG